MLDMTVQDVFMNPFGAFFEVQVLFIPGHIEKGEKGKYFSYPDYFTYTLLQHWSLGQRCPDNQGCTVYLMLVEGVWYQNHCPVVWRAKGSGLPELSWTYLVSQPRRKRVW